MAARRSSSVLAVSAWQLRTTLTLTQYSSMSSALKGGERESSIAMAALCS